MARLVAKKDDALASDLAAWSANDIPGRIRNLPGHFRIRLQELGLTKDIAAFERAAEQASSDSEALKAEYTLRAVAWKVINLMRLDSNLPVSTATIDEWPADELVQPHWGNDFEASTNPKNPHNNQNTVSPRPGWFYRMVELNWLEVLKQLRNWEPERDERSHVRERKAALEEHPNRKVALAMCEEIDTGCDDKFYAALKARSKKLEAEVNARAESNKRKLEQAAFAKAAS